MDFHFEGRAFWVTPLQDFLLLFYCQIYYLVRKVQSCWFPSSTFLFSFHPPTRPPGVYPCVVSAIRCVYVCVWVCFLTASEYRHQQLDIFLAFSPCNYRLSRNTHLVAFFLVFLSLHIPKHQLHHHPLLRSFPPNSPGLVSFVQLLEGLLPVINSVFISQQLLLNVTFSLFGGLKSQNPCLYKYKKSIRINIIYSIYINITNKTFPLFFYVPSHHTVPSNINRSI